MKTKRILISAACVLAAAICGPHGTAQTSSEAGASPANSQMSGQQATMQGGQSDSSMSQGSGNQSSTSQGAGESDQSGSSAKQGKRHHGDHGMASYPGDKMFLQKAVDGNNAEIDVARMAQTKGQSESVRQFAQQMLRDHGQAANQFRRVMDKQGVAVPTEHVPEHQKTADRLSRLNGKQFDQAYAAAMVKDHRKMVAMCEQASQSAKSADVKKLASNLLPTLREHLQMAQKLPNG